MVETSSIILEMGQINRLNWPDVNHPTAGFEFSSHDKWCLLNKNIYISFLFARIHSASYIYLFPFITPMHDRQKISEFFSWMLVRLWSTWSKADDLQC